MFGLKLTVRMKLNTKIRNFNISKVKKRGGGNGSQPIIEQYILCVV
jgi:hypothetical protein